ncbi:MAG: DUF3445 domain-containing protein [Rhodospirillales bacterium]|nr:DUF3445 domain-containing protein [Rhodospirillales bacterium]
MGLIACPERDWIELDDRYRAEMAERRALLATRRAEVFGADAASVAARAETLALLAAHLPARFPGWFEAAGARLRNRLTGETWNLDDPPDDPLIVAGLLVQEDLCIVAPRDGAPVLAAAVLCFPSRWLLADKLGRALSDVHGPVPGYGERLARPVDRFMASLKPGRIAARLNWSLLDDPALFQPEGKFRDRLDPTITPENAPDRLWLRVERQTLRLLPASGAVLFGIRVHVYPLRRIVATPAIARRLAAAVAALPEATARYKSIAPFRAALLAYVATQE